LDTLDPALALERVTRPRVRGTGTVQGRLAQVFIVLALVFTAVAVPLGDTFFLRLGTEALIFSGLAMSVDLLLGFTGMLSLGQALYFGIGAYASALVLKHVTPSFWAAIGVALVVSTVAGSIAAFLSIRARGVYFALITFGMAQVVSKVVYNTRAIGGSDGIIGIPQIKVNLGLFQVDTASGPAFFLLVLTLMLLAYFGLAYLLRTPAGRLLVAVRTNENRVPFLGYNTRQAKFLAFVLAADLAAFSGALYPMLRGFVSPELMYFHVSGDSVVTVIIGGLGTLIGPIYGSIIVTALKSVVGTYTEHYPIIIGSLFMLAVVAFPRGLVGGIETFVAWRRRPTP
jgi:branched-chain amino acid transport system permease protein